MRKRAKKEGGKVTAEVNGSASRATARGYGDLVWGGDEIREVCKMWETVHKFVEKHHPSKAVAVRAMNLFNNDAMSYFREILKRKQKRLWI
jgi:hypothetical protein